MLADDATYRRRILWTLAPTATLVLYVETMVVPALPVIADEFNVSLADTSWILTVYLLVGAASPPVLGRMGDIHGKKRMLLIVQAVYIASLVASAFAPTLGWLIATRTVQGIGFTMFPLAWGIVRDEWGPERMAVAQGVISAMFGVGGAAGLAGGAWITQNHGWRATYESIVPFALILWIAIALLVRPTGVRHRVRIDYAGAALLVATVLPLLYAIVRAPVWGWPDARIPLLAGSSLFFAALFILRMTTAKEPLIHLGLLRDRDILLTNVLGVGIGFGMFTLFQTVAPLIQSPAPVGFGGSVLTAGLAQLPMSLTTLVTGPFNGRLVHRLGPRRPLITGLLLMTAGFGLLFLFRTSLVAIMLTMALFGFALSLTMVASINLILIATPATHLGVSTAMNQTFRITGGSLGPAVAAFYFSAFTTRLTTDAGTVVLPSSTAYAMAFASAAVMVGLGAAVAVFLRDRRPGDETRLTTGATVQDPGPTAG